MKNNYRTECYRNGKMVLSKEFKTIKEAIYFENTVGMDYELTKIIPLNKKAEDELFED